jgi:hypothetical protein
MCDLVVDAIEQAGRPLSIAELTDAVRAAGYRHEAPPKNPNQLRASISALPAKSTRVKRVGSGLYDVTGVPKYHRR